MTWASPKAIGTRSRPGPRVSETGAVESYHHRAACLTGVSPARLRDADGLSALLIAAAGSLGLNGYGPPVQREGPREIVVAHLCRQGHIVIHAVPEDGLCLVDLLTPGTAPAARALEVMARRLGAGGVEELPQG